MKTKHIPNHHEYTVDETGKVYRLIPAPIKNKHNGTEVKIGDKYVRLSRLVATLFLPKPDFPDPVVFHRDGDKTNNAVSNLVWVPRPFSGVRGYWGRVRSVVAANPTMQIFHEEVFE